MRSLISSRKSGCIDRRLVHVGVGFGRRHLSAAQDRTDRGRSSCAALRDLVVIGLWHLLADANLPYLLGALTAFCLAILAAAVRGFGLRRALIRLFNTRLSEAG